MRHRKKTVKLGRNSAQREALLASLVSNLILAKRITTTLPKARAAKPMAEKMVTFGKKGTLAAQRHVLSRIKQPKAVSELAGKRNQASGRTCFRPHLQEYRGIAVQRRYVCRTLPRHIHGTEQGSH